MSIQNRPYTLQIAADWSKAFPDSTAESVVAVSRIFEAYLDESNQLDDHREPVVEEEVAITEGETS